jgi:hypothetical protein
MNPAFHEQRGAPLTGEPPYKVWGGGTDEQTLIPKVCPSSAFPGIASRSANSFSPILYGIEQLYTLFDGIFVPKPYSFEWGVEHVQ